MGALARVPRYSVLILCEATTLASLYKYHKNDYVYLKQAIDDSWENVLLNQCTWLSSFWRMCVLMLARAVHDGEL
jgi:hypothetical protein